MDVIFQNEAIKLQCIQKIHDLKKLIHVIANDEIFHLLALSELVVKCHPHTFNSVYVAPTIQPLSSGLPDIYEGRRTLRVFNTNMTVPRESIIQITSTSANTVAVMYPGL